MQSLVYNSLFVDQIGLAKLRTYFSVTAMDMEIICFSDNFFIKLYFAYK